MVKCGYCGKIFTAEEWKKHQFSHGHAKTPTFSIDYKASREVSWGPRRSRK